MLIPYVIGAVVGAGLTLLVIFTHFKVKERESWEEQKREMEAAYTCAQKAVAENVKVRVALAAAELTEDAKKVAAVTMAALGDGIVGAENVE
jgi:hypothetical protein